MTLTPMREAAFLAALCGTLAGCERPAASSTADWRRGATCYEVFVRSFRDSDGDGIGDLRGLTQKLDYINDGNAATRTDLGARCIWLMPIVESPTYHGYDATNYYRVEPDYGTNDDFRRFVAEAHRRGIAVIIDLVLNHLSSEHPYFQSALGGPTAPYRDWFRWAWPKPTAPGPWGQNAWHRSPHRDEYYYGVFWHTMPDLDYATPAVRDEAKSIATFWLTEMNVDGFRLDAVPYLVEEGTQLIGAPGTHAFLREYAAHLRTVAPNAFTVGEVWDGLGTMLPYYPDQLESYFAFDLSDELLAAVRTGSATKLLAAYMRFQDTVPNGRWSTFLRNHDQTRTLTALGGGAPDSVVLAVARAKLAVTLLLSLPGLPFIYYGEEIGMTGDKPDERIRTPMQWGGTPGAGFTTGTPWQPLQPDWTTTNVAAQDADTSSLLALHRTLIHLRAEHTALGTGELLPLATTSDDIAAYLRRDGERAVLVVANLGRTPRPGVTVAAADSALPPGRYAARSLLGGSDGPPLIVSPAGRFERYVPVTTLRPLEARIFDLVR
jgi:alpha-amylase